MTALKRKATKFADADGSTRWKLINKAIIYYAMMVVGPLAVVLIRLVKPLIEIRVGWLMYLRMGDLSGNSEYYLRALDPARDPRRVLRIFVGGSISGAPANSQLFNMVKREIQARGIPFFEHPFMEQLGIYIVMKYPEFREKMPFFYHRTNKTPIKGDDFEKWNECQPQLQFNGEEEMRGKAILKEMGIAENEQFVCFFNRSQAYLNNAHDYRTPEDWVYHDYRNCSIENYMSAADFLATEGMFALRTGYIVDNKLLASRDDKIIDYASDHRSDFGDVYLHARCAFIIGCETGNLHTAEIFNVPVAEANVIPLTALPLGNRSVFIPKKFWDIERKRFWTFREIFDNDMDTACLAEDYKRAGIELIENSADEILELAREMTLRVKGEWQVSEEDEELQNRFRSLYKPQHICYGFLARIGTEFLRQNRDLLD